MSGLLKGEGDVQIVKRIRVRHECERCGEPATKRITFLYENARRNPRSSAYGKDDCSYCADSESFSCDEHERSLQWHPSDEKLEWCSTFSCTPKFEHMFLFWHEEKQS